MKETKCPHCNHKIDAHTDPSGEETPGPGDLSMCLYCGEFNIFTDDMDLRKATEEDLKELPQELMDSITEARHFKNLYDEMTNE